RLPEYMMPAAYVYLAVFPFTSHGTINRQALPRPESDAFAIRGYEAPQGETESKLAEIWAEVLKLERVGRTDNFFDLGGRSLLTVLVASRLRQTFGVELTMRDLFEHPVLVDLADVVQKAALSDLPPITRTERAEWVPLSFAQQRLWFLAQMGE